MRILIAEDDPALGQQLRDVLAAEGYAVDLARAGDEVLFLGSTEPYDLVVLDIGLPERDGISILKKWRQDAVTVPVLILTARDGWSDRVDGLDAGADDYMIKPFHMAEFLARVRAMLRRHAGRPNPAFRSGAVEYNSSTGLVTLDGLPVSLTAQETAVVAYLFHHAGRFVSRAEISDHIYAYDSDRDSNTIAVFVNRLRRKLGPELIETNRGLGYRIVAGR